MYFSLPTPLILTIPTGRSSKRSSSKTYGMIEYWSVDPDYDGELSDPFGRSIAATLRTM